MKEIDVNITSSKRQRKVIDNQEPEDLDGEIIAPPIDPVLDSKLLTMMFGDDDSTSPINPEDASLNNSNLNEMELEELVLGPDIDNVFKEQLVEDELSCLRLSPTDFVKHFSQINIVRNRSLQNLKKLEESFPKFVPMGNSRDHPSLFLFRCKNAVRGCQMSSWLEESVDRHQIACLFDLEYTGRKKLSVPSYHCSRPTCNKKYATQRALNQHVRNDHDWEPKKCDKSTCPDFEKVFVSGGTWEAHVAKKHDETFTPQQCKVPNCSSKTTFKTSRNYNDHLTITHKLRNEEKAKFLPPKRQRAKKSD